MRRSRLSDDFEKRSRSCRDDKELADLLHSAALELGFRHFALLHHRAIRHAPGRLIRLHNYPPEWEGELGRLSRRSGDPVHLASARTNAAFGWDRLGELLSLGPDHRRILEASARFGLGSGFTVPANVPGEPCGSCSFVAARGQTVPAHRLACAELIGARAFEAARRLHAYPLPAEAPRLSRRERQCLRLVAAGKTDWEAAAILGLSVETTRQYVKRARAAFDAVTRSQLVALGLRDCVIAFDDPLPHPGE